MKVVLSSNLKFNGKRFAAGDAVDLPKDVAEQLIASRSADLPPVVKLTKAEQAAAEAAAKAEQAAADAAAKGKA